MTLSPLSDKLPTATPYTLDSEGNLELELNPLVDVLSEVLAVDNLETSIAFKESLPAIALSSDPGLAAYQVLEYIATNLVNSEETPKQSLISTAYICLQLALSLPEQP